MKKITAIALILLTASSTFAWKGQTHSRLSQDAIDLLKADLRGPLFVVVGGEKRGVARKLIEHADLLLQIPYARHFSHSLGTTAAAAILGYEVMRQRR